MAVARKAPKPLTLAQRTARARRAGKSAIDAAVEFILDQACPECGRLSLELTSTSGIAIGCSRALCRWK